MDQLWGHFQNVSTINLSQNYLTEKTVDSLIAHRSAMPALRSVVLSQNAIKERQVKGKLEELGKMGLSIGI